MSASKALGNTGLRISPLVLGGNVFGWTLDARASHELLSAAFEAGITTVDTADVYSNWVEGHTGGESELIIGQWLAANPGLRDRLTLFTKVGAPMGESGGLSRQWILRAVEDSLRRLQTDIIDLYQRVPNGARVVVKQGNERLVGEEEEILEQPGSFPMASGAPQQMAQAAF